ncbi:hypothetical protein BS636_14775 [Acinetobacter sp. LoGeW2-3]|uniref:hypothetical protein n=1 Tax=Acinetobacter sp. LoGeW2-3 TaxID=1808001 RepID=UPI000C05A0A0|nr:hypothetical protein [Acinetobacter sp. LoGeW2-3]ATO20849.1 hypothetical protein BS636_14775 [Acinetobacter sp. LoGeW2-3]
MIGHQRDILATLGIDIWIPRAEPCQPHQPALWRDQSQPEVLSEIILPELKAETPVIERPVVPIEVPAPVVEAPTFEIPFKSELVHELREIIEVAPFSLQALSLAHCTIVIDASTLTEDQQLLWANIQRAVLCEFSELNWPFPWDNVQDGRGVESYIQGFLDVMSHEKNIIFLGKVPHFSSSKITQLASLQEMLDRPILKKRLWQFMQSRPVNME